MCYDNMKEEIKNLMTSTVHQRFLYIYKTKNSESSKDALKISVFIKMCSVWR